MSGGVSKDVLEKCLLTFPPILEQKDTSRMDALQPFLLPPSLPPSLLPPFLSLLRTVCRAMCICTVARPQSAP